jgi:hypothetical protein
VIRLTKHAEEAIAARGIDPAWVATAITAPDRSEQDPLRPELTRSFKAIAQAGNRVLRVVHRRDHSDIVVITVHFDRGARP